MQLLAWESVRKEVLNDKLWRKLVSGEKVMVAQLSLSKGCVVPLHDHESEQISCIMQGALKFELEGREIVVRTGEVLVIPSRAPHSALALEDTLAFDIFSPIRQDWLEGTDSYLRK
jgi:quercetin dioxygenase-like cupin family protein